MMPLTPEQKAAVADAKREGIRLIAILDFVKAHADHGMISRVDCLMLMAEFRQEWERDDG
jgi:hypothetical protein